jgi:hypothetical protein
MLPIVAGIVSTLIQNNLPKVAQAVVDKGLDYVQEKTGMELKPDMTQDDIKALRDRAMQHEEFMVEQANKNTADARAMQVAALINGNGISRSFVYVLATFWSLVAASYIFLITMVNIPEANVRFADTVLGFILATVVATILNFFFGSSAGSKAKQETIESKK